MTNYIVPQIVRYQNIDGLLENSNSTRSLFDTEKPLSIDKLLQENFVCIVGEPGIGKSRLVDEIKKQISKGLYSCTASEFELRSVPKDIEYCIIDALDEVEGNVFYSTLLLIKQYKKENPDAKVWFTCRKHYVASYAKYFTSCYGLTFIELCRLSDRDVMEIVNRCSEITKANVNKSSKLKELLTIPRYLTFLLEYEKQKGGCPNISELFEYIIGSSIQTAIDARQNIINNESIKILIQRVLEKVAFVMEISRKDQISKDELYTILDGVKGNMTQMLIANFDLLFFESRILKETNGILQFENTELQEYLAAKELCRQDNIESVLYNVAVQKELKHIHPNWYDVIPHISYTEDRIYSFINIIKLIVSYESNLENESFESLLRYVNTSVLLLLQKEELFSIIFEHYLRVPAYIKWKNSILKLIQECYTSSCNDKIMLPADQLNKIQLANIYAILEAIVEENKLDKDVSDHWTNAANILMQTDNEEKQLAALNLYNALKSKDELIHLSKSYNGFTKDVKEKYCEVTGYGKFTSKDVVDCWLDGCYVSNPYALNAVLCVEDLSTIIYAYNKIICDNKLYDFFNPKGTLLVCYDLYIERQFDIAWNADSESRKLMTKIIASFMDNHSYATHSEINVTVKQILLEEETGILFLEYFDNKWDLEDIFRRFDAELIDIKLLSSLDKLLHESKMKNWYIDNILTTLINKIRNDEAKRTSISEYIKRYTETFERWDKNSEEAEVNLNNQPLIKAYQSLSDADVSEFYKYEAAFELSKNIKFIRQLDIQPLVDVIAKFFNEIDLDKMILEKKAENSFSLSKSLVKIPYYVKAMYHLGVYDLLEKNRVVLAKTLPIVCCTMNFDASEIKEIYKSVIGSISENEKSELVEWWKSREDDFMNISSEDIFTCITDYGIDAISYKLEKYIEQYIDNQELSHSIAASKALDLISEGYCKWDIKKYKDVFDALEDDNIASIKMQCNAIMIEKYQDSEAITWRIEYIRNNIVKSLHNETGHMRAISMAESEMISPSPRMFRCFMTIKENERLTEQMFDLFDFGLSLCINPDTQEYSSYLLNQIYLFFVNADNIYYISELRKKVEIFNAQAVSYLANNIMNNAEMMYLKKEKITIDKAIKQYNKCIEEYHLEIRNDSDLRRYFTHIHSEVQKEIQDQGIYTLVRQETLSEDFIQRELKNTIINKCCQMGLEAVRVDREVTLQDNKRTDLLIRYGLCNPIMVELKLLHNDEIQSKKQRQAYRDKFIQYTNATNACLSVFWVFDVHKKGSDAARFKDLEVEYKDLDNTLILLTDCKCSSGIETGLPKNKQIPKLKKTSNDKTRKGKK